jgi:spoIIIJ-associated protein
VNDAIIEACQKFTVASDKLEVEVVEEGSSGFLGIGSKPAVIRAKVKSSITDIAKDFLDDVFRAMSMVVVSDIKYDEDEKTMDIELSGDEMGVLIGKRGQTLDSLQYLVSLVVNKDMDDYIRVKVDTENYRQRRKETLENLAKNISFKVKRTKRAVSLEPMNPYERRIIHSALQNDRYVTTHSEGNEPYRHVVVTIKRER